MAGSAGIPQSLPELDFKLGHRGTTLWWYARKEQTGGKEIDGGQAL